MSKPDDTEFSGDRQPGPFSDTESTTFKISAFDVTITKKRESSHVPPPEGDCGCGGGGTSIEDLMAVIGQAVRAPSSTPES